MQLGTAKGEPMIEAIADQRADNSAEHGAEPGWTAKQLNEYNQYDVVRRRRNSPCGAVTDEVPQLQFSMQRE